MDDHTVPPTMQHQSSAQIFLKEEGGVRLTLSRILLVKGAGRGEQMFPLDLVIWSNI